MPNKIISWIKHNKLTTVLVLVLLYLLFGRTVSYKLARGVNYYNDSLVESEMFGGAAEFGSTGSSVSFDSTMPRQKSAPAIGIPEPVAPQPDVTDRMVITNSSLSLQVANVTETIEQIKNKVSEYSGWIVNSNIDRREFGENAVLSLRVPSDKVEDLVPYLRELAVKVVNEDVSGTDITDQYVDLEERLLKLYETREKFEEIYDRATTVDEILRVQQQIFSIQNQIDSTLGQMEYYENSAKTSLVTIYLSTDETGLPYSPPQSWRPEVVFKYAVRSLIGTLQKAGSLLIWLGVYSIILVPAVTMVILLISLKNRRKDKDKLLS